MEPGNQNQKHTGRRAALGLGVLGLALAGVVVTGALPRLHHSAEMNAEAQQALQTDPSVNVITPTTTTGSSLLLPGNIQAAEETTVYARTSGYLRRRLVDIGSKVRAGELLAEIESPEVDQQLRQAQAETLKSEAGTGQAQAETARLKAAVAQAIADAARLHANLEKANSEKIRAEAKLAEVKASASNARAQLALAKQNVEGKNADLQQAQAHLAIDGKTSQRWQGLAREGAVSQQDADERLATYQVSKANVRSYESAILSAQAQVEAAQQSVNAAESPIAGAQADIRTSEQDIQAARSALESGEAKCSGGARKRQRRTAKRRGVAGWNTIESGQCAAHRNPEIVRASGGALLRRHHLPQCRYRRTDQCRQHRRRFRHDAQERSLRAGTDRHAAYPRQRTAKLGSGSPGGPTRTGSGPGVSRQSACRARSPGLRARWTPPSRTLVTEVQLSNKDGKLIPGMYAQVKFDLPHVVALRLPSSALLSGSEGTRIALIAAGNKVHYVPVKVGRDFGSEVEILTGITANDQVIVGLSGSLKEGTTVRPIALPAPDHK